MGNQLGVFTCDRGHVTMSFPCKVCGSDKGSGTHVAGVVGSQGPRVSKMKNVKMQIENLTFDSTLEAACYLWLRSCEDKGTLHGLRTQEPIALRGENFKRVGVYNADFVYYLTGNRRIFVDVKGRLTDVFKLKLKVFEAQGLKLEIVTKEDVPKEWQDLAKEVRDSGLKWSTRK